MLQVSALTHKVAPQLVPEAPDPAAEAPAAVHGAPENAQVHIFFFFLVTA